MGHFWILFSAISIKVAPACIPSVVPGEGKGGGEGGIWAICVIKEITCRPNKQYRDWVNIR